MSRLSMSRRSFVKAAALTGVAGVLASTSATSALAEATSTSETEGSVQHIRTACRACGKMECGTWVTVQDGKVIKIEGDESAFQANGNCCTKSQASVQASYHPDRIHYPMKRVSPKDEDDPSWERITWDEAYSLMSEKFTELYTKYNPSSLIGMGGTSRIWSMAPYGALGTAMGGSNNAWTPNEVCKGPRWYAADLVSYNEFSFMATVDRPQVYVQWGGSGELSNYDDACRTVVDCASEADIYISVDPRKTNLGHEADIWCNLLPGTDAVLALSWANVIISEGLIDETYVRKWTDAPFLVCEDMTPSGWANTGRSSWTVSTHLLKESDVDPSTLPWTVDGEGSMKRFIVYDELNDELTYYDAEAGAWRGETWTKKTEGKEAQQKHLAPGASQGFVINASGFTKADGFEKEIYPSIYGSHEITLKNGTKASVRPSWEYYVEETEKWDPETASERCGVDPDTIRAAARAYATRLSPETGYGNGGIQYMLAVEHAGNCVQNCRAVDALTAITGNYDTPAGMRGATQYWFDAELVGGMPEVMGPSASGIKAYDKAGTLEFPLYKTKGPAWSDAESIIRYAQTGEPYPIVGGFDMSGDMMSMGNTLQNWEVLKGFEFWVVADLWFTPTAGAADIVLPPKHWLEVNCPRKSQGSSGAAGATCKCVEAPGECHWDPVIAINFFKAMGLPWANGTTDEEKWPGEEWVCNSIVKARNGETWAEYKENFQKNGWIDCKKDYPVWGTYRRYETGDMNQGKQGWPTSTGKHEIWSVVMESTYADGRYNVPTFIEPPQSKANKPELYDDYPYTMTTGRRIPVYFHSEHRQLPWCREQWMVPRVEINPNMAKRLGIEQGDWCWIETKFGKIRQMADLYYGIEDGVINCEHQWWLPEIKAAGRGFELVCINCLVDPDAQDPCVGSSNLRAYPVNVYKATAENSPYGNPVPVGLDGAEIIHDCNDPRLKEWLPDYTLDRD